jgi:hypothetical protein
VQKYGRPELFIGGGSLGHASRKVMHREGVVHVPVGASGQRLRGKNQNKSLKKQKSWGCIA